MITYTLHMHVRVRNKFATLQTYRETPTSVYEVLVYYSQISKSARGMCGRQATNTSGWSFFAPIRFVRAPTPRGGM